MNHILRDPDTGEWLRRFELAYLELLLAIEYQGRWHRQSEEVWASDIRRREEIDCRTWRIIEVIADDLDDDPLQTLRADRGGTTRARSRGRDRLLRGMAGVLPGRSRRARVDKPPPGGLLTVECPKCR